MPLAGRSTDRHLADKMVDAADTLIARLQADCTAAEARERAIRATVEAQIREAEQARAFAWRRLGALGDMARIAALEPDRERAVERQLVGLFRDIGWIESSLEELADSARPLLDRLRPIAEALHAEAHPVSTEDAETVLAHAEPLSAFRAFEAWYEAERGQPFLQVFERYVPPTPLVEF